jgi:KUP system potassium uptake protein
MSNNNHVTPMKTLMLGAIGVVFGDIGTSPLYAFKECLKPFATNGLIDSQTIIGICSLIFWAIFIVVSLKYVVFVMKADNKGEGGILSLMSLANLVAPLRVKQSLLIIGLIGAATFYGDSVITPAISVLSAVEGMELIQPSFSKFVIPVSFLIILGLFYIQKSGTTSIGKLFGPIMIIWFITLTALGIYNIIQNPIILKAINPVYGISFVLNNPKLAIIIFGSVFLALTGGEALYADMGHFGIKPINLAWFYLVFPSLAINYFGQGALILNNNKLIDNPFYNMAPSWLLIPLVILATAATVIASQAVISGAFSMTKQAIQLGYIPRVHIKHTSDDEIGQIYIPFINWSLFLAVTLLLFTFKTSDNLSAAYGIAVVTTMLVTTILMGFVIRYKWNWNIFQTSIFLIGFLFIDSIFLVSNALKIEDGGWLPLAFAAFIFFIMTTWKAGRKLVFNSLLTNNLDLQETISSLKNDTNIHTTYGSAVFLNSVVNKTPVSFMHNLKHNHILHENILFLTMNTEDVPYISEKEDKYEIVELAKGAYQIIAHLGFKEIPNVPNILKSIEGNPILNGWTYNEMDTSFFLSRETIVSMPGSGMNIWREKFFSWLSKNSTKAAEYFNIPSNRVVELGAQVCI